MAKKIIAVDADDTLFDENTAVRLFMNDTHGFQHTAEDYLITGPFENYWESIWNLTPGESSDMYEEFVVSSYKQNLKPITNAIHVLKALKEKYKLVIVTSRDQRTAKWTHDALAKHYPDIFEEVYFSPVWGNGEKITKAKICNEIGASYLIDDSFGHCELAAESGVRAILFGDYGWNREQVLPDGVVRCKDWNAVRQLLLG